MTKSLEARRRDHAERRLSEIRTLIPDLPQDALSQATLRQLSFRARRVRGDLQHTLLSGSSSGTSEDPSAKQSQIHSGGLGDAQSAKTSEGSAN